MQAFLPTAPRGRVRLRRDARCCAKDEFLHSFPSKSTPNEDEGRPAFAGRPSRQYRGR